MFRSRPLAAAAAALFALPLLAGCGEGAGPPQVGHPASGPITEQRVEEFGRTVNLRASDLPSSSVSPDDEDEDGNDEADPQAERVLKQCFKDIRVQDEVGVHGEVGTADSNSFAYREGEEAALFASSVSAYPTPEEGESALRAFSSRKGFPCFEWAMLRAMQKSSDDVELIDLQISRIEQPLPLGTPGLAVRVHAPFRKEGEVVNAYFDLVTFSAGNAMVTLEAIGFAQPVSQDVEAALALKLLARAERHPL